MYTIRKIEFEFSFGLEDESIFNFYNIPTPIAVK